MAAGAAFGWCVDANAGLPVPESVSRFAFEDAGGSMGRLAFELGNVYRATGFEPTKLLAAASLLVNEPELMRQVPVVTQSGLETRCRPSMRP